MQYIIELCNIQQLTIKGVNADGKDFSGKSARNLTNSLPNDSCTHTKGSIDSSGHENL